GAVHDGVAAIEPERILKLVEPLAGRLVAAVDQPAIGLQQDRGTQELAGIPPIAWAAGRAAGAKDALIEAVELGPVVGRLQPLLARGLGRSALQPRLDRGILRVEVG